MAQVTVYLPQDVLDATRKRAKEQNSSLSAWLARLVRRESVTEWPKRLMDLLHHGNADLVATSTGGHSTCCATAERLA